MASKSKRRGQKFDKRRSAKQVEQMLASGSYRVKLNAEIESDFKNLTELYAARAARSNPIVPEPFYVCAIAVLLETHYPYFTYIAISNQLRDYKERALDSIADIFDCNLSKGSLNYPKHAISHFNSELAISELVALIRSGRMVSHLPDFNGKAIRHVKDDRFAHFWGAMIERHHDLAVQLYRQHFKNVNIYDDVLKGLDEGIDLDIVLSMLQSDG